MKKALSLLVSILTLAVLYQFLDIAALKNALAHTDPFKLAISTVLLVILVALSAIRLTLLGRSVDFSVDISKSIQSTFVANALNMVLPGKLGDLLKSIILSDGRNDNLPIALGLSIWERVADLAMIFVLATLSLGLLPVHGLNWWLMLLFSVSCLSLLLVPLTTHIAMAVKQFVLRDRISAIDRLISSWLNLQNQLLNKPFQLTGLLTFTLVIWAGHLLQICLLMWSLGISGDQGFWLAAIGTMPAIIVAGLIPLTFAGVGTRDAALVLLLGPMIGKELAAALGVLFWLRYLVPGLLGLVFLPRFFQLVSSSRKHISSI